MNSNRAAWLAFVLGALLGFCGCQERPRAGLEASPASQVGVTLRAGAPLAIKTSSSEFDVLPSGYIRAFLLKDGKALSLDEPEAGEPGNYPVVDGKQIRDFTLDLASAKVSSAQWKTGSAGKRIEISGRSPSAPNLKETLTVEVFDDFPNLALATAAFQNTGASALKLDRIVAQRHLFDASRASPGVPPYQLWSFQGASFDWGQDTVLPLSAKFVRPNVMGAISPHGNGGGVPVVAFWTASVGEAIGHIEMLPLVVSLPVKVEANQRVSAALVVEPGQSLKPGEAYTTPRTFLAVYAGDYYEPLRLYSEALQHEGWPIPQPRPEDFEANWCGWGYQSGVTPAQMRGTIPKLKEFNIKWATLDYRWFQNFGQWEPRPDNFPDDSLRKLVEEFHQQGILVQIWWVPLAVGDGQAWEPIDAEERTPASRLQQREVSQVVKAHPDWLILDKNGKPARLFLNRAALCPALPEVQEYYRNLTVKLIRDWGLDGHKLDMCFTVPACYNPAHHHQAPQDSVYAVGKVFKVIFDTTRQLKPEAITQICPCGTTPNIAWLPYEDQAVTADPVGALQVRQRIKMYKALLGPEAAVYGDHVELSAMKRVGREYLEFGADFASTIGTGGVVGTKFTWPDYGPKFKNVYLTAQKEAVWKKWIALYQAKMLSRGEFRNLYVYGYDVPEGYAIEKDGKMDYAFFAPEGAGSWKGELELRGLGPGKYRVTDYEHAKDLGTVEGPNPKLAAEFQQHLLLEVSKL